MGRRRDESPRPLDRGDPREKFPHPLNAPVLAYLAAGAAISDAPGAHNVDEYVLHTHPDFEDVMTRLARELDARARGAYGYRVLTTRHGLLFALAAGTSTLGVRLPERAWPMALEFGGMPWPEAGPDWIRFSAWDADVPARQHAGDLRYFTEVALDHAVTLGRTPGLAR
jgi:hypothetical protein